MRQGMRGVIDGSGRAIRGIMEVESPPASRRLRAPSPRAWASCAHNRHHGPCSGHGSHAEPGRPAKLGCMPLRSRRRVRTALQPLLLPMRNKLRPRRLSEHVREMIIEGMIASPGETPQHRIPPERLPPRVAWRAEISRGARNPSLASPWRTGHAAEAFCVGMYAISGERGKYASSPFAQRGFPRTATTTDTSRLARRRATTWRRPSA